ncbi:MAG TPA: methionyl-tRNA formyltransferase [Gemmatimonadales bacterium]|nr:methionyl-tRNA formyltransferase [Gemmatimonadales bacterium]
MDVVFFGSPDFAVPSLRALVGEGFNVRAVVTQPDRPTGRSRSTTTATAVKAAATAEGLDVLQPEKPTDAAFLQRLRDLAPDVGVVVGYGHILRKELLSLPRRGMVNVHPSLLPALRGAAPIEWTILHGIENTGVTIMQLDEGMDSGPILHQLPHRVAPGTTAGELGEHLAEMGAQALIEALALWEQDGLKLVPQNAAHATYAPKLTREVAHIDWTKPADVVARQTLALDPRPGAWSTHEGKEVKLFLGRALPGSGTPGEVTEAAARLVIATGDGLVEVAEVQPAGKERMPAGDWVRGRGTAVGRRFT